MLRRRQMPSRTPIFWSTNQTIETNSRTTCRGQHRGFSPFPWAHPRKQQPGQARLSCLAPRTALEMNDITRTASTKGPFYSASDLVIVKRSGRLMSDATHCSIQPVNAPVSEVSCFQDRRSISRLFPNFGRKPSQNLATPRGYSRVR